MTTNYALVTGGARGIGRAICLKMAEMGYNVLINYVSNLERAQQVRRDVEQLGVKAELIRFDVGKSEEVHEAMKNWKEQHPDAHIEILVNNAGIRRDQLMMGMTDDDWHSVMNTNVNGFYHVTRSVLREMVLKRYGRVINIVSGSGLTGGFAGQTNYAASKAAVIGATKSLAMEVGRKNITVNAIAPGFIRTEMIEDLAEKSYAPMIPLRRFGQPEEVAELVGFIASSRSSYITGQVMSVSGGIF